jgi:hypothetical protein
MQIILLFTVCAVLYGCNNNNSSLSDEQVSRSIDSLDSIRHPIYRQVDSLISKSVYICTYFNKRYITEGTGFFLKIGDRYYLASNYHIIAGRASSDTTLLLDSVNKKLEKYEEPNMVYIRFHGYANNFIDTIYKLKNGNTRIFISTPAEKNTRKVLDICLLPITQFPHGIVVDAINYDQISKDWIIKGGTYLYLCGYRYTVKDTDHLAVADKIVSIPKNSFKYADKYILANSSINLKGDSGSPVYAEINGKFVFVGIHSMTIPHGYGDFYPEILSNRMVTYPLSVVLSASNLLDLNLH